MERGKILEHKLDKEWMMVLEDRDDRVACRTKSYEIIEFYKFELQEPQNRR